MDNTDIDCASTARLVVDPSTNDRPTPRVNDQSTARPWCFRTAALSTALLRSTTGSAGTA